MALYEISRDIPGEMLLDNLVLLAPDIDSDRFRDAWPDVMKLVRTTTLYVSDGDKALKASRSVNGYPRLGEGGEYLTVLPGIETIDVSLLQTRRASGHVYHLYNPDVVADLVALLGDERSAGERPNLQRVPMEDKVYWQLIPKDTDIQHYSKNGG
jgi:esterase/lipase superfamily enzyme